MDIKCQFAVWSPSFKITSTRHKTMFSSQMARDRRQRRNHRPGPYPSRRPGGAFNRNAPGGLEPGAAQSVQTARARAHREVPGTATWVLWADGAASPVGFVSRAPWATQPRPGVGEPRDMVALPFRRRTLAERHGQDPSVPLTEEERAALCPVCGVLVIHEEQHRLSLIHNARGAVREAARAASFRNLTDEDASAALVVLRRLRPEVLRGAQAEDAAEEVNLLEQLDLGPASP